MRTGTSTGVLNKSKPLVTAIINKIPFSTLYGYLSVNFNNQRDEIRDLIWHTDSEKMGCKNMCLLLLI